MFLPASKGKGGLLAFTLHRKERAKLSAARGIVMVLYSGCRAIKWGYQYSGVPSKGRRQNCASNQPDAGPGCPRRGCRA